MATEIPIIEGRAFFSQNISLLRTSFLVSLNYNSTDAKWRLTLENEEKVVIRGQPLSPNNSPTRKYQFEELRGGNFWCIRKQFTEEPVSFENLGFDKDYGLFFLTDEEEVEIGL